MSKKQTCDNKHLSLDERKIIQKGIENRCNKVNIARTIGKDPTTIAKEIRKHREFKPRNVRLYPNICIHRKECGTCFKKCELYQEPICKLRDRSPGACNKCPKIANCHLDKYFYYATKSNQEYLNGKTPYELQEFLYGKEIIEKLNIKQIKRDEVILKPYLIKHIYK